MSVHFLYFLFKWKGVKPTNMFNKTKKRETDREREREREREEQQHNPTSKTF